MIAENTVHGREHRFPFRRTWGLAGHFNQTSDKGVHTVTDELNNGAHRRITRAD